MKSRLALLAVPLLALACGNSPDQASPTQPAPRFMPGMGGTNPFHVYCNDDNTIPQCNDPGAGVIVTAKVRTNGRDFGPVIETCLKDGPNECDGTGPSNPPGTNPNLTYCRDGKGLPWTISASKPDCP